MKLCMQELGAAPRLSLSVGIVIPLGVYCSRCHLFWWKAVGNSCSHPLPWGSGQRQGLPWERREASGCLLLSKQHLLIPSFPCCLGDQEWFLLRGGRPWSAAGSEHQWSLCPKGNPQGLSWDLMPRATPVINPRWVTSSLSPAEGLQDKEQVT